MGLTITNFRIEVTPGKTKERNQEVGPLFFFFFFYFLGKNDMRMEMLIELGGG